MVRTRRRSIVVVGSPKDEEAPRAPASVIGRVGRDTASLAPDIAPLDAHRGPLAPRSRQDDPADAVTVDELAPVTPIGAQPRIVARARNPTFLVLPRLGP
jgi:hypothetical protein